MATETRSQSSIPTRIKNLRNLAHDLLDECESLAEQFLGEGGSSDDFDDDTSNQRDEQRISRRKGRTTNQGKPDMRFKSAQEESGQRG